MPIETILQLIENHGITFVISAWVLFYLFRVANLFYGKLERKMINAHAKELKQNWPKTIEKNNLVHQLLYKALYEFNWDRAYIYEYHNGGHSISGIDFLKASNTFEVVNDRVQPQQLHLQNLPVGMFAYFNNKILNKQSICKKVDDIQKEDLGAYQVLKQNGINNIFIIGLFDAKWYPIGFFGIDYVRQDMPNMCESMLKKLEIMSYQISGLLY